MGNNLKHFKITTNWCVDDAVLLPLNFLLVISGSGGNFLFGAAGPGVLNASTFYKKEN